MRRTLIGLAVATVMLCAVHPAAAVIREKGFELSTYGGIQSGDSDEAVASDNSFGLRIAYAITPKIEIEAAVGQFNTSRDITGYAGDPATPARQIEFSSKGDTDFTYYTIGLLANFLTETDSRTLPFVGVGLGSSVEHRGGYSFCVDLNTLISNNVTCDDVRPDGRPVNPGATFRPDEEVSWQVGLDRKDTGTLLNVSGGARTFFGDWFALRYEAHYYHHDSFEHNQDAFEFAVGASFVIGGRR